MSGIYIHIPYCRKICNYCDFYHVIKPSDTACFVDALIKEMKQRKDYLNSQSVSTVYMGGGTPSVLNVEDIERIMNGIFMNFHVEPSGEITMELNPDDISAEYLKGLKRCSVNRLSVGIQSWDDRDLAFMNRRHNAAGAKKALYTCFDAGFENVSADLIYGIPGMSSDTWENNLDTMFSFNIRHLSVYHLSIEEGTRFFLMKQKGSIHEIDEKESINQYHTLIEKSREAGFEHYEISNFCKPGYHSVHNSNYWKQVPYLGLGPSAHSYDGCSRQWNISNVNKYIASVNSNALLFEKEQLDTVTRFNEYILTSTRTKWGIDLHYVESIFGQEYANHVKKLSKKHIMYGLMKQNDDKLVLTDKGIMISDNIIRELFII